MGNEVSRSNTHIANGTGKRVHVFYSTDKMLLYEMEVNISTSAEVSAAEKAASGSVKLASDTKLVYHRDERIRSFFIPAHDFNKVAAEGTIYMTVYYDDNGNNLCQNYHIPSDRSVILTPEGNVKFQKYGASIWEDEYGNRYG